MESKASQPLSHALAINRPVEVDYKRSYIDGMGATSVLDEMWPLARRVVDHAIRVPLAEFAEAVRLLAAKHDVIAEGVGADRLGQILRRSIPARSAKDELCEVAD